MSRLGICLGMLFCLWPATLLAGSEEQLRHLWQGAWVLTAVESYSACGESYTDNQVRGSMVTSRGHHRFDPGEPAKVEKLHLKRRHVDVLLTLAEPLRTSWQDGPFTLYDHVTCRVELEIDLPRGLVKQGRVEEIDAVLAVLLLRHEALEAARASEHWNKRRVEPYPEGYGETLTEHEIWKVEQMNRAVQAKLEDAVSEAAHIAHDIETDADYLRGFAEGVEDVDDLDLLDCEELLSSSVYAFVDTPSSSQEKRWRRGYEDGQALLYYLELARRLRGCYR